MNIKRYLESHAKWRVLHFWKVYAQKARLQRGSEAIGRVTSAQSSVQASKSELVKLLVQQRGNWQFWCWRLRIV